MKCWKGIKVKKCLTLTVSIIFMSHQTDNNKLFLVNYGKHTWCKKTKGIIIIIVNQWDKKKLMEY